MTRKRWTALTLCLLILSLGAILSAVFVFDPFEVYHQAWFHIPPIENSTQNYSNAGIAKSYDYDSVVIGSSMTENFSTKLLEENFGGSFIKLPINAGTPFNHRQMMEMAFGTHDVKRIVYGIDIEAMTWFYSTPKCEMPDYLYDDNLFNDTQYWFNSSVLLKYIPACLKTLGQSNPDLRDTMYNWGALYEYGKEAALRDLTITDAVIDQNTETLNGTLSQQSKLNVQHNYLPFIQAHPDTEFIFFFPPYSLAKWYTFYQAASFEYHLDQKIALINALLPYENVKIYDFQAETDWILNLDHYIDTSHYGPWINDAMTELMAGDEYRILSAEEALSNNQVLRDHLYHLVSCGKWPDDFHGVSSGN